MVTGTMVDYHKSMWLSWYNWEESKGGSKFQEEDIDEIILAYCELWMPTGDAPITSNDCEAIRDEIRDALHAL